MQRNSQPTEAALLLLKKEIDREKQRFGQRLTQAVEWDAERDGTTGRLYNVFVAMGIA
ncbi:MAG: hypothetical protein WEC75_05000 [Dehalococcoidia bacterium]